MDCHAPTVYLVRHAQTALNAQGRLRGHADPDLDQAGLAQAQAAARALAQMPIRCVHSSPLLRAVHTATIIAAECGLEATIDEDFTDRDYGPWTGELTSQVTQQWGSVDAAPGVEPLRQVRSRARQALDRLTAHHPALPILIVTHDAVIRALLTELDPGLQPTVPTASWATLNKEGQQWHVLAADQDAV